MIKTSYYGDFDSTGLPKGFYNSDIYPDLIADEKSTETPVQRNPGIPFGAIEITHDQWQELISNQGARRWDASAQAVVEYTPPPPPVVIPPFVSLQEFRSGLDLWMRDDGNGGKIARLEDVYVAIKPLIDAGNPLGKVAMQQLEYANNVEYSQLLKIRQAFGFSETECAEAMWRALDIRNGIYTGETPANSLLAPTAT